MCLVLKFLDSNILGESSVLHCASLLRTIFASSERANECVHAHNEKRFPQAKIDSEINVLFLINMHGDLYFYHNIIVYITSSIIKKNYRTEKKDIGESVLKTVTLECKL